MNRTRATKNKNISFFLGIFLLSFAGVASAMTQEELTQEALYEKVTRHGKLLEKLERLQSYGDLRLRYEIKDRADDNTNIGDGDAMYDTARPRYRFRFGAKAHVLKDIDVVFRLSTGGASSNTSGNQTFGDTFAHDDISLNLAYIKYDAGFWLKGLTLEGGKTKNPFMSTEVVWDGDVTFEGINQSINWNYRDTKAKIIFAQYFVEEAARSGNRPNDDVIIYGSQIQLSQKTGLGKFKLGAALYAYDNLQDHDITNIGPKTAQRNAMNSNRMATDMEIFDLIAEFSTKIGSKKFKVFGEYIQNINSGVEKICSYGCATNSIADDLDTAWQLGVKLANSEKMVKFGDWKMRALYRLTQQDAVFAALNDSDFHDSGTNSKGWKIALKAALRKGMTFGYSFFSTENERGALDGSNYDIPGVHQFDLVMKF